MFAFRKRFGAQPSGRSERPGLVDDPSDGESKETVKRAMRAVLPIGAALEHDAVVRDLGAIERDFVSGGSADRALQRFELQMDVLAEAAGFVRRTAKVFRSSVAEMVDIVGSLAKDEPRVLGRLSSIRERLVSAADVDELERLRAMLLDETSALVEEMQSKSVVLHHARERVTETQAQVEILEAALEDARAMAVTDALTGLGNRRALEEVLDYYAGARTSTGVIAVDVDHFKRVNDTWGHGAGDMVLRHVAQLLARELRGDDRAFRVGGEELLLMLYDTSETGAMATAERLRERLAREPVLVSGDAIEVTASFGVATWGPGERFKAVAERADAALYRAKSKGRNRVERG